MIVVSGVQPAGALCPDPSAVDHDYTVTFAQQLRVAAPGLLVGSTPATGLHVETSWQHDSSFPSDDVSFWGNAAITYGTPGGGLNRNGGFTYTPDPTQPFSGDDSFDYTLINACGDEADATANVTVVPIVVDASYTAMKDTPLVVSAADGFLAHDAGVDAFFSSYDATSAHGGTIDDEENNDGSFVYTPPADFVGTDTFGYTTQDLDGDNTYSATVHIDVLAAFTAPAAPTAVVAVAGTGRANGRVEPAGGERKCDHGLHRRRLARRKDRLRPRETDHGQRSHSRRHVPVPGARQERDRNGAALGAVERRHDSEAAAGTALRVLDARPERERVRLRQRDRVRERGRLGDRDRTAAGRNRLLGGRREGNRHGVRRRRGARRAPAARAR